MTGTGLSLGNHTSFFFDRNLKTSPWFMLHRIREAWKVPGGNSFAGPVEVDESYFGGKRRNMRASKRKALTGRGAKGKTAVVAMKDRASNQVRAKVCLLFIHPPAPWVGSQPCGAKYPGFCADSKGV